MAIFLFLILLCIDIVKDTLTKRADKAFGYKTIATVYNDKTAKSIIIFLIILTMMISMKLIAKTGISGFSFLLFSAGLFIMIFCIYFLLNNSKRGNFITINILRFWVFVGIIAMLLNGIEGKL